ncbi:MAG: hypothetical protein E6G06_21595 [Actinobacteria bacterium]|nr:MAG: hypothetical protein E6G06_21595 [Actinomycetota bacterium]
MRVDSQRLVPWVVRVSWIALPFTAGPPLADALDAASRPVQLVASSGLWTGWAVGVVAVLVPHPLSLTALRIVAPASVVAVVAAATADHVSALALVWATVSATWAFAPAFGLACVNGPAYPNERRFPLRVPGALLVGPLVLAWALAIAGVTVGPLLVATRQWVAGAIAIVVGAPVAVLLTRSMHVLSRRWAVFVPAGLVLHDPLTLADPVLFPRQTVEVLRPAPADSDSLDLTQRAPGLALELLLLDKVELTLVKPGVRAGEPGRTTRLLFTPTRPGAVLEQARTRRIRTS